MVTRHDVLEHLADLDAAEKPATIYELASRFRLSLRAAEKHLGGLWTEQLVESVKPRPPRRRFRLMPGEHLGGIRFRLTERGRRRLAYFRGEENRQLEDEGGPLVFQ